LDPAIGDRHYFYIKRNQEERLHGQGSVNRQEDELVNLSF
jgi:hypothetical protein